MRRARNSRRSLGYMRILNWETVQPTAVFLKSLDALPRLGEFVRPHDLLARELGGSRHPRCYPHFQTRVNYSLRRTPPFSRSRSAIRPCLQSSDARLVKASSFRPRLGAPSPSADRPDPIGS